MADLPLEPRNWVYWLDKKNNAQLDWAAKYLARKKIEVKYKNSLDMYTALRHALEHLEDTAETREFIRLMRLAWSQRKYRKGSSTHKPCNFVLTRNAHSNLKSLSKRTGHPMNGIIDSLLTNEVDCRKRIDLEVKDAIRRTEDDLLAKMELKLANNADRQNVIRLEAKLKRLTDSIKAIQSRNIDLLRETIALSLRLECGMVLSAKFTDGQDDLIEGRLNRALKKQRYDHPDWYGADVEGSIETVEQDKTDPQVLEISSDGPTESQ